MSVGELVTATDSGLSQAGAEHRQCWQLASTPSPPPPHTTPPLQSQTVMT